MSTVAGDDSQTLNCQDCTQVLQDYVDGDLPRDAALKVFLHVRQCPACERSLQEWQALVQRLGRLPQHVPPADFDAVVLAKVPYAAYLAMAPLRRQRVPVYLEESFLPAFVRDGGVRIGGMLLAAASGVATAMHQVPESALVLAAVGALPEILVRLQSVVRRAALKHLREEGGS